MNFRSTLLPTFGNFSKTKSNRAPRPTMNNSSGQNGSFVSAQGLHPATQTSSPKPPPNASHLSRDWLAISWLKGLARQGRCEHLADAHLEAHMKSVYGDRYKQPSAEEMMRVDSDDITNHYHVQPKQSGLKPAAVAAGLLLAGCAGAGLAVVGGLLANRPDVKQPNAPVVNKPAEQSQEARDRRWRLGFWDDDDIRKPDESK